MKVEKGMSVEDVLEALKTIELLGQMEPALATLEVDTPREEELSVVERLRNTKIRPKRVRKKKSWQAKKKTRLAAKRRHYESRLVRRNAEWADMLESREAASWWRWFRRKSNTSWAPKKGWEISEEEYTEHVHPRLRDIVPSLQRINTRKPWTLDNVRFVDPDTREVLFDGSEHEMRIRGYIL